MFLLADPRIRERGRYGEPMLKKVGQLIESVSDTSYFWALSPARRCAARERTR
jgi:hypothetical protein